MKGSCLCGQIRYEVSQLESPIQHCSCQPAERRMPPHLIRRLVLSEKTFVGLAVNHCYRSLNRLLVKTGIFVQAVAVNSLR